MLFVSFLTLMFGCDASTGSQQGQEVGVVTGQEMNENWVWEVMNSAAAVKNGQDIRMQEQALEVQLVQLTDEELVMFSRIYERIHNAAYTWDLWAAAYFTSGGCSDDGFTCFRNWVIGRGKVAYFRILENPDNLADYSMGEDPALTAQCAEWDLLPGQIWESRDSSRDDNQWFDLWYESPGLNREPVGEPFDEDDIQAFKAKFPRLAEEYHHLWD
tara:strand:- start:96 stop:740 length:645 start_codon:yes stop_codon:yes gene_type:complete